MLAEIFDDLDTHYYFDLQASVIFSLALKLGLRDQEVRWLDWTAVF